jgi:hypothetical protein
MLTVYCKGLVLALSNCGVRRFNVFLSVQFHTHFQVFEVPYPTAKERSAYLEPLFLNEAIKLPSVAKPTSECFATQPCLFRLLPHRTEHFLLVSKGVLFKQLLGFMSYNLPPHHMNSTFH